jgi:hypothetical protein
LVLFGAFGLLIVWWLWLWAGHILRRDNVNGYGRDKR